MEKKPIARNIRAIHIMSKPTAIIVSIAPKKIRNPAVLKACMPVFSPRRLNDLLRKLDATTNSTKSMTRSRAMTMMYGAKVSHVKISCHLILWNIVGSVQLTSSPSVFIRSNAAIIITAMNIAIPTIAVIIP